MAIFEVRVHVPKPKLGDLAEHIETHLPYARIAGFGVIVPSEPKMLPAPTQKALPPPDDSSTTQYRASKKGLSKQQASVLNALLEGPMTRGDLFKKTGMIRLSRVINTLKKKKLVKYQNGTYTVAE